MSCAIVSLGQGNVAEEASDRFIVMPRRRLTGTVRRFVAINVAGEVEIETQEWDGGVSSGSGLGGFRQTASHWDSLGRHRQTQSTGRHSSL